MFLLITADAVSFSLQDLGDLELRAIKIRKKESEDEAREIFDWRNKKKKEEKERE